MATKKETKEDKVFSKPKATILSYPSKTHLLIEDKLYPFEGDTVYNLKILLKNLGFQVNVVFKH